MKHSYKRIIYKCRSSLSSVSELC